MSAAANGAESPREVIEDDPQTDAVRMGLERDVRRCLPLKMGHGLVRSEVIHARISRSQSSDNSVPMQPVSEPRRQHLGELFNFPQTARGKLDEVRRTEEQPSDEALQARVRRIPADNMEDRIIGDRPAEVARVGPESVQDFRVAELQAHDVNKVLRCDLSQQRKAFRRLSQGDGAFRRVHRARISSAGREQPRGRAAGSRPISSKSSRSADGKIPGLKRAARPYVCEIENSQNSGLAICAFATAFRIDDEERTQGAPRCGLPRPRE